MTYLMVNRFPIKFLADNKKAHMEWAFYVVDNLCAF